MCSKKLKVVVCVTAIFLSLSIFSSLSCSAAVIDYSQYRKKFYVSNEPVYAIQGTVTVESDNPDDDTELYPIVLKNATITRNEQYGFTVYRWQPFSDATYPHIGLGNFHANVVLSFDGLELGMLQGYNMLERVELGFKLYCTGKNTALVSCDFHPTNNQNISYNLLTRYDIPPSLHDAELNIDFNNLSVVANHTDPYFEFDLVWDDEAPSSTDSIYLIIMDYSSLTFANQEMYYKYLVQQGIIKDSIDFQEQMESVLGGLQVSAPDGVPNNIDSSNVGFFRAFFNTESSTYQFFILLGASSLSIALIGYVMHGKKGG